MPQDDSMNASRPCTPPDASPAVARSGARHQALHPSARTRALPHARALMLSVGLLLSLPLAGCGGQAAGAGHMDEAEAQRQVEKLIELCTPLDPNLTSDHHDRQLHERRALVEALCARDETLSRVALAAYDDHSSKEDPVLVRVRLLEVAGHADPERTRPRLVELVQTYGYEMADRTEAVRILAETSPATAIEVLEPMLEPRRKSSTTPNDEFLVRGYVTACRNADVSPVPLLAEVVTDFYKEDAARHYAAEALGDYDDPLGIEALETVLVESTGNGYLRRKAAQSLRKVLPAESACALFTQVAEREADTSFLHFMASMIEELCP